MKQFFQVDLPPEISHIAIGGNHEVEATRDRLTRWADRNEGHHSEKRSSVRREYHQRPILAVGYDQVEPAQMSVGQYCFEVWGRGISCGGVSVLCHQELLPNRDIEDYMPIVSIESIVHPKDIIAIALPKEDGQSMWLSGVVAHMRPVEDDFYEIGIAFLSPLEISN